MQVGAGHPSSCDPVSRFVSALDGWSGILIEPQPKAAAALRSQYDTTRFTVAECAISDTTGLCDLFHISDDLPHSIMETLPEWHRLVASLCREHLLALLGNKIERWIESTSVPAKTLNQVFLQFNVIREAINILCIDTEGSDLKVLSQIDFEYVQPSLIIYEHAHLSDSDKATAVNLLLQHGYAITPQGLNVIALR